MKPNEVKILIIEDDDFDYELIDRKLKNIFSSYSTKRVQTESELRQSLKIFHPDLILSDFHLPQFSGSAALDIIRAEYSHIPFVFVSGAIGEESAVEVLKKGAIDYVLKGNLNKLEPAIMRALNEANEKRKRKETEEKLRIKHKELNSLVYKISHDIRGPICTIKGTVNLMREEKDNYANYLTLLEQVLSKMDGIVINLSSFQFLYAEKLNFTKINIKTLIQEIMTKLNLMKGFNEVDIKINIKDEKEFYSDKGLIDSVFYNLINNSINFSDHKKSKKDIICNIDMSGDNMKISVEDNGIGIPIEIQNRVFEMFFRGTILSKGAGLGLYIVKTAVERLEGSVEIISENNKGTKVLIEIPINTEPVLEAK